jgi:hypothetical protein
MTLIPQFAGQFMRLALALLLVSTGLATSAAAQGAPPAPYQDPLVGNWSVTDTQTNTGTVTAEITKVEGNVLTYTTKDSEGNVVDSGTIAKINGGYAFQSNSNGGSGVIQSNGDTTYAWSNTQTGAGGVMTKL